MRPLHRVLLTGATGFVGRAVIQALRAEGYVVRCLVRRGSEPKLRGVGAIERVAGDVLAPLTLEEGMAGCDAVVHLVGIIREHLATNATFDRVHVQGTLNVIAPAALPADEMVGRGGRARVPPALDDLPPVGDLRARRRLRLAAGTVHPPPAGRAAGRRRPPPARGRRAGRSGRGPRARPARGREA